MVLGGDRMKPVVIALLLFLSACVFAEDKVTDHAVLYYNELSLLDENGSCVLHSIAPGKTTRFVLGPEPPCYFVRYKGKLEYFTYPRLDADFVVIMFGTPFSDEDKKVWEIRDNDICGKSAQALIIKNNVVQVTEKISKGGLSCTYGGHDEKDYWLFAHDHYEANVDKD